MIPLSPYEEYCVGYGNPGVSGTGYVMGLTIGVGKAVQVLSHEGSQVLDATNAFDRAEVDETNLGQTNMITVSSFCGPEGKIWGLDLARAENLRKVKLFELDNTPVYSAEPLLVATTKLLGTVDKPNFKILPGSHIPCATKNITVKGPTSLYAAIGVGVPQDREIDACLMMEDVGQTAGMSETEIMERMAKSILMVGVNQNIKYVEIFTHIKQIEVIASEIGCALVAAPYLALAKGAVPEGGAEKLSTLSLTEWDKML